MALFTCPTLGSKGTGGARAACAWASPALNAAGSGTGSVEPMVSLAGSDALRAAGAPVRVGAVMDEPDVRAAVCVGLRPEITSESSTTRWARRTRTIMRPSYLSKPSRLSTKCTRSDRNIVLRDAGCQRVARCGGRDCRLAGGGLNTAEPIRLHRHAVSRLPHAKARVTYPVVAPSRRGVHVIETSS